MWSTSWKTRRSQEIWYWGSNHQYSTGRNSIINSTQPTSPILRFSHLSGRHLTLTWAHKPKSREIKWYQKWTVAHSQVNPITDKIFLLRLKQVCRLITITLGNWTRIPIATCKILDVLLLRITIFVTLRILARCQWLNLVKGNKEKRNKWISNPRSRCWSILRTSKWITRLNSVAISWKLAYANSMTNVHMPTDLQS